MARGTNLIDFNQEGVSIAVNAHALYKLEVPRRVALSPILTARARPERHSALRERSMQSLIVHPPDHKNFTRVELLDNSGK